VGLDLGEPEIELGRHVEEHRWPPVVSSIRSPAQSMRLNRPDEHQLATLLDPRSG
jgi:hypothetical protein